MLKRTKTESGEERVTAKSKPMNNLVSRCSERTPDVLPSTASGSPGKTRHESQFLLSSQTEQHCRTGTCWRRILIKLLKMECYKTWSSQEWNLMNLMEHRTGDLFYSHSTRTNSLVKTIRWILTPKKTIEEPIHMSKAEKSGRPERDQDLRCQSGPSAKDSVIFSGGDSSKNYGADQQRLQISDLHYDKFPTPACWKIRFKTEVCTCSQFLTEAMQWIK